MEITLKLTREDAKELAHLSDSVGFPPELAAIYAIRLVSACVREGLFADMAQSAWPQEARWPGLFEDEEGCGTLATCMEAGAASDLFGGGRGQQGKVLAFERMGKENDGRV